MHKGAGFLTVAVITAIMVALTSLGVTKVNQAAFGGYNSSRIMLQAQQYAEAEAAVIKATAYSDLTARSRVEIQNSNGYYSEVSLSAESDYSENVKQKIASINIYKGNEALPRYTLNILKTDAEVVQVSSGVPIGTIIAWPSNNAPTEGGTWLLCNGGTFSSTTYAKLYSVLGSNTLPSLNGRFLEGTTSNNARNTKNAGLPNITGSFPIHYQASTPDGAFYVKQTGTRSKQKTDWDGLVVGMDASRCSAIYGASTTVQPASYLVKYFIKAL